jgi:hypothetical protein
VLDTYTDLVAAVRDWANHSKVTDARAAGFIRAAERRAYRALRIPEMEVTTADYNGAVIPKDFLIGCCDDQPMLPSDLLEIKDIWSYCAFETETPPPDLSYGGRQPQIRRTSVETMNGILSTVQCGGVPQYFARDNNTLLITPITGTYFVRMTYWATPAFLSDAGTNRVFATCPDMFLYGALSEAALFLRLPDDAKQMDERFSAELQLLQERGNRAELSGSSLVQRTVYG